MLTPAEELGLAGAALDARVRRAVNHIPDSTLAHLERRLAADVRVRAHIDIETDDIAAEVKRLEKLGAKVVERLPRWVVMQVSTGQRFCVVRVQRPGFPKNASRWD